MITAVSLSSFGNGPFLGCGLVRLSLGVGFSDAVGGLRSILGNDVGCLWSILGKGFVFLFMCSLSGVFVFVFLCSLFGVLFMFGLVWLCV